MPDIEVTGPNGATWRIERSSGQVFLDPSTGTFPPDSATDVGLSLLVQDAAGQLALASAAAQVIRPAAFPLEFTAEVTINQFDDLLLNSTHASSTAPEVRWIAQGVGGVLGGCNLNATAASNRYGQRPFIQRFGGSTAWSPPPLTISFDHFGPYPMTQHPLTAARRYEHVQYAALASYLNTQRIAGTPVTLSFTV